MAIGHTFMVFFCLKPAQEIINHKLLKMNCSCAFLNKYAVAKVLGEFQILINQLCSLYTVLKYIFQRIGFTISKIENPF